MLCALCQHRNFNTAIMNDKQPAWKKRLPARIYDYNYKVSEGYYQPQTKFIENRNLRRDSETPPEHKSYAERFADQPWYGDVRGLPYGEEKSALAEPLYKLADRKRGSSLVQEIKQPEEDFIPLHIRASRRRRKFEEEERNKGVRPKLEHQISLPDHSSRLRDTQKEINKINEDFFSKSRANGITSYDYGLPSRTTYNHDVQRYRDPLTGSTVNRTSRSEHRSSSYSSRPPLYSSARTSSNSDDYAARSALTESVYKPWSGRRASYSDDASSMVNYNRAEKFREVKRNQESRDVASDVSHLVDKLRISKLDPDVAYNFAHSIRSSSVEPLSRRGSRKGRVVYGVAK